MKKALAALLAVFSLSGSYISAQQTKILTAEKHNEYGLVYSLPTTALQIRVTAVRETFKAGPYSQYAKRYLGKADVISQDKVVSKITGVEVTPVGVSDTNTKYLMQLKAGQTAFIGVDANGMLLTINTEPSAPVAAKPGNTSSPNRPAMTSPDDYLKYVDMDFVSALSSIKQAEMIASSLMDVRDAYLSLTRGTADNMPSDGRQLELMLASLREQEDALTRAFTGTSSIEEYSSEYLYIPDEDGEAVLCRLSDFEGFVDPDDYSGAPLYISTEVVLEGQLPVDVNGETKKLPKDAVIYAIPGSARVKIYTDRANFYDKDLDFSQFGTTFGLDPKLFTDKKAPSFARFSSVTGALLEIGKMENPME